MIIKNAVRKWGVWVLVMGLLGCGDNENNQKHPAMIHFLNESSFTVNIYKNFNPEFFDPTTLICTVDPGQLKKITVYASTDQKTGDTFYIRYNVLLADSPETGTRSIYIEAQRDLSNITFVVEEGKTYTKTIPQPVQGQLRFINGYITIQNLGSAQIQIINGSSVLSKMDNQAVYLGPGQRGFYEIPFSFFDESLSISQLKAFSGTETPVPSFILERGKLYSFVINGGTVTGPVVTDIVY
jgi:hypothetical protein